MEDLIGPSKIVHLVQIGLSCYVSYDGTRILASSYSYVYSSIDSGVSWRQETTTASWSSIASSSDGINLAPTVSDGYIYTGVLDVVALLLQIFLLIKLTGLMLRGSC